MIIQKSIGFEKRQVDFMDEHPEFNIQKYIRKLLDEQINVIDPKFLEEQNEQED